VVAQMTSDERRKRPITPLTTELGFWASVVAALTFVSYTICFAAILATSPIFTWTSLADYLAYDESYGGPFRAAAQVSMIIFALTFLVLLHAIRETAPAEQRVLARISTGFGALFALAVGTHYFVQLTAVRINVREGLTDGLEHFVQANPYSILSAINMLGWSVFLGLSSLFIAPVFRARPVEPVIRAAFWANGLFCLSGGLGYAFEITWLVLLTTTFGMGGALLTAAVALALWFRKGREHRDGRPGRTDAGGPTSAEERYGKPS